MKAKPTKKKTRARLADPATSPEAWTIDGFYLGADNRPPAWSFTYGPERDCVVVQLPRDRWFDARSESARVFCERLKVPVSSQDLVEYSFIEGES